jgi:hypothetical protein
MAHPVTLPLRRSSCLALVFALTVLPGAADAFHSGGVAECEGCHSMHNSFGGSPNVTNRSFAQGTGIFLLKANDQSGTCLNCHHAADTAPTGYHVSTAVVSPYDSTSPVELTAGGDFAWLKKTMNMVVRGNTNLSLGERHGHNIVAADYGYVQDGRHATAPGGTYPVANLHCSSCHDPHGRYRRFADGTMDTTGLPIFGSGSYTSSASPIAGVSAVGVYRKLAGIGYQPKSLTGSFAFVNRSPVAVSPPSFNGVNTTMAGTFDRVAYGSGFSEWCGNCHASMVQGTYTSGMAGLRHPAGNSAKFTASVAATYAAYVFSGVLGAPTSNGYSALAPFETGADSTLNGYTALKDFQATPTAPSAAANVFCLSCHRSHASAFESKTRFSLVNEFMTIADSTNAAVYDSSTADNRINQGYNVVQQTNAYNGRPATLFGPYARTYCNKCHGKD